MTREHKFLSGNRGNLCVKEPVCQKIGEEASERSRGIGDDERQPVMARLAAR